mgnify:CR=1 FL=1
MTTENNEQGKEFWAAQRAHTGTYKAKSQFHITFPPCENGIKLLNMAEVTAPGGLSIVFKLPFPMGEAGMAKIIEAIRNNGGSVDIEN